MLALLTQGYISQGQPLYKEQKEVLKADTFETVFLSEPHPGT